MRKLIQIAFVALLVAFASGCATSLNSYQKREYRSYQAKGLTVEEKSPGTGAVLGLLPGGGSFYARAYGLGIVNLLFWPLSILWDPVSGYDGALAINYYETRAAIDKRMRYDIGRLDDQLLVGQIDEREYVRKKRAIETRYSP